MHLDVDSLVTLTTMRQAEIRREVAGYRLAGQVRTIRSTRRVAFLARVGRGLAVPVAMVGRFLAGPAQRPVG